MFVVALIVIAKTQEIIKYPSPSEWKNKLQHIHIMKYLQATNDAFQNNYDK